MRALGVSAAILVVNCIAATAAMGQAAPAGLPADCSAYATVPLPAEADKAPVSKTAPECASYRFYRGIGHPVNYAEARACAWQERVAQNAGQGDLIGGSLILADLYINGFGVERNVPLAIRFACESEEGMAMLAAAEIAKLNGSRPARGQFEFCDYATSTFTQNFCSGYASEIEDEPRIRYYNSLKSSMPAEQQVAFEKLLAAQDAYVEAHTAEVYRGGSIRNMRALGSEDILKNLFHTEVVHFEGKRWAKLSSDQVTTADALLQREYEKKLKQLRKHTKEEIEDGEITVDDLSGAEKSWELYRDAWVAFARLRYPAEVDVIRAEITLDRYRLVETIS
jgi:hypothetical protein